MNRRTADQFVAVLIVSVVGFGVYSWWQAYQNAQTTQEMMSGMMDGPMPGMPGMNPIWYLFGTLITVSAILGVYLVGRTQFTSEVPPSSSGTSTSPQDALPQQQDDSTQNKTVSKTTAESFNRERPSERSGLTMLPDDERKIIEPILDSPGLTQVELRGRSDFSKAKVSQTVSKLEDRGLIYREKQGRTYRVYPGELLKEQNSE